MADQHDFCRVLLRTVRRDLTDQQRLELRGSYAYLYTGFRDHGEWHGPGGFYWHGTACCAFAARSSGISAWLAAQEENPDAGSGSPTTADARAVSPDNIRGTPDDHCA